jgi:futalosine hydrolase
MTILLVAATEFEVTPLTKELTLLGDGKGRLRNYVYRGLTIDLLITGVGMTATSFYLGKVLCHPYDCAINLGLAGSFNAHLELGNVVNVVQDCFSELGAEDGDLFLPVTEMNLSAENEVKSMGEISNIVLQTIPKVNGITVNTVHGHEASIEKIVSRFHPITESMEGAAFLFACTIENVPCAQIRSISNLVEKRNRSAWNLPLAIDNLNVKAIEILNAFL